MFICFKCKEVISAEDLKNVTIGNSGSIFCPSCTKEREPIKKELEKRFPKPCATMERYVGLIVWGIDPAGDMYNTYIDNNLIMRRK